MPGQGLQTIVDVPWIPQLGVRYHLAADGISLTLIVLTGLAAVAGILFSWNIEERTGEFFALYLALIGGVYGVFLSADAFTLFVFYEIAIVPKYFLIANWGSTNREYGAMKLVLYSFAGSALVLAGLLWAYAAGGAHSFAIGELAAAATHFSRGEQLGMFALVFFGFATLAGIFPLHTWAPTGHVAAPTAASMLLAGVVMKLGAYGCLRVAMPLFPAGLAFWQPTIAWLAIAGIIYAGLVALVQQDFKFVIAYSSVSHMGFVLLGLAAANLRSVSGAVLQMFSHGVIAGLLFAVVGRMVYDRTAHAPPRRPARDAAASAAAVRGVRVCRRRTRLDGHAGLQRLPGRTVDPDRHLENLAALGRGRRRRRPRRGGLHPAGDPGLILRPRRSEPRPRPRRRPSAAADHARRKGRRRSSCSGRPFSSGLSPTCCSTGSCPSLQSPLFQAVLKGGRADE